MHSVVHEWLGWINEYSKAELARKAIITVAFSTPVDEEAGYWLAQKRLLPHANNLVNYMRGKDRISISAVPMPRADSDDAKLDPIIAKGLPLEHPLCWICWLYFQQEQFEVGKSIAQDTLAHFEQEVGRDHPITVRLPLFSPSSKTR
jgi:hypothetical protein